MKKYLLELPEELHAKLKIKAVKEGVTMNDLILGSIKKRVKFDDASELIARSYNFVKGGPNPYLEEDLKEYCESMSLKTR